MSLSLHYFAHNCNLMQFNTYFYSLNQCIPRKHRMLIGVTHTEKAPDHMKFDITQASLSDFSEPLGYTSTLKSLKDDIICNISNLNDHRTLSDAALPRLVFCSTLFGKQCLIVSSVPAFSLRLNHKVPKSREIIVSFISLITPAQCRK